MYKKQKRRFLILILLITSTIFIATLVQSDAMKFVSAYNSNAILLAPAIQEASTVGRGQSTFNVFYDQLIEVPYDGGPVCLSSQSGYCSPPAIDDAIRIYVDGSEVFYYRSYTQDFGPVDFSQYLQAGSNEVRVQLIDLQGPERGSSALYLVFDSGGDEATNIEIVVEPDGNFFSPDGQGGDIPVENQTGALFPYKVRVTQDDEPVWGAELTLVTPFEAYGGTTDSNGISRGSLAVPSPPQTGSFNVEIVATVAGVSVSSGLVELYTVSQASPSQPKTLTRAEAHTYNLKILEDYAENPGPPCPDVAHLAVVIICSLSDMLSIATRYQEVGWTPQEGDVVNSVVYSYSTSEQPDVYVIYTTIRRNDTLVISEVVWTESFPSIYPALARRALVIELASPVTIFLTDPETRSSGTDPETGTLVFDFPMAISNVGAEPYFAILPQPDMGEYSLLVIGNGNGPYNLTIFALDENGNQTTPLETNSITELGLIAEFRFGYDESSGVNDITPPSTSATVTCSRDLLGVCRSSAVITLKATDDFSDIDRTWYSFDDGETWLSYTAPFNLTDNGIYEFLFKSVDQAGNEELPSSSGSIEIQRYAALADTLLSSTNATTIQAQGVVHSNGDVSLINNTTVLLDTLTYIGQLTQSGNVSLTINQESQVTDVVTMPDYPLSFYQERCNYYDGTLMLFDTSPVYDECLYVSGNVWNFTTGASGSLTLVSEGTIYDYSTNSALQAWDNANGVLFYALQGYYTHATGAEYTGIVYVPTSTIDGPFTNWHLSGGLFGNSVEISGGTTLYAQQAPGFPETTHQLPLSPAGGPPPDEPTPTLIPTQEPSATPTSPPPPTQTPMPTFTPTATSLPPTPTSTKSPPPSQEPPGTPILLSPVDGDTADSLLATLDWSEGDGASGYKLQIATFPYFGGSYIVVDVSTSVSEYTLTQNLEPDDKYYWRVMAFNDAGDSEWTSNWEFFTPMTPPSLLSPSTGSVISSLNPTFTWDEASGTYLSQIQVSLDGNFNDIVLEDNTYFEDYSVTSQLEAETTYYWRVRSRSVFSDFADWWSPTWSFTIP